MKNQISLAFQKFQTEAPGFAQAWSDMVQQVALESALDTKTHNLAFLSVLAVLGLENGIPYHVHSARKAGATRDEVISAVLVGLPPAGHRVTQVLPIVIHSLDDE